MSSARGNVNLPRGYISYNQVRLYQTCPKKYYFSYIEEIKTSINDRIFLGMVFHAVVEDFLKIRIEGQGPEPAQGIVLDIFKKKFVDMQKDYEICWISPPGDTEKRGSAFVKHFLSDMASAIDPMMVEQELEVDLPGIGVKLRGIIDLVEKDFSITDFKTTTSKWSKERIKSSYLQMVIYRYLFEKSYGSVISQLKFRIIYSKNATNIKNQMIARNAADFDIGKMFSVIKYVVENISSGVFYKNESFYCGFCEHLDVCQKTK
jgi:hypothetical protein